MAFNATEIKRILIVTKILDTKVSLRWWLNYCRRDLAQVRFIIFQWQSKIWFGEDASTASNALLRIGWSGKGLKRQATDDRSAPIIEGCPYWTMSCLPPRLWFTFVYDKTSVNSCLELCLCGFTSKLCMCVGLSPRLLFTFVFVGLPPRLLFTFVLNYVCVCLPPRLLFTFVQERSGARSQFLRNQRISNVHVPLKTGVIQKEPVGVED